MKTKGDDEVTELPGGGFVQCPTCFVYNRITSTFCSACETLLPKTASINVNLWMGTASREELETAFAEQLYNSGIELFHEGKIEDAEGFFEQAMEYAQHPDYAFFHGLCRLAQDDVATASANFDDVLTQQYSGKYPFWPLPLSPGHFKRCLDELRNKKTTAQKALVCFMRGYEDYLEKKRKLR